MRRLFVGRYTLDGQAIRERKDKSKTKRLRKPASPLLEPVSFSAMNPVSEVGKWRYIGTSGTSVPLVFAIGWRNVMSRSLALLWGCRTAQLFPRTDHA